MREKRLLRDVVYQCRFKIQADMSALNKAKLAASIAVLKAWHGLMRGKKS